MPKMKSHKSTQKRVQKTKSGKLMREHSYKSHFLSKKSSSRKRAYKKKHPVTETQVKSIKRSLGL